MTEIDVIISGVDVAISDVLLTSSDDKFTSVIVLCSGLDSVTFVLFRNRCHRRLTIYAFSKTFMFNTGPPILKRFSSNIRISNMSFNVIYVI